MNKLNNSIKITKNILFKIIYFLDIKKKTFINGFFYIVINIIRDIIKKDEDKRE